MATETREISIDPIIMGLIGVVIGLLFMIAVHLSTIAGALKDLKPTPVSAPQPTK